MITQSRSEEWRDHSVVVIQSNSDLRLSGMEMVSERRISGRTGQHEDVRLPIQSLDCHFCNPQRMHECRNREEDKPLGAWVCEESTDRGKISELSAVVVTNSKRSFHFKWTANTSELLWLCSCALTNQCPCGMWEAAALEWGCEIQCSWWMHTPCGLCHTPLCSSAFNI